MGDKFDPQSHLGMKLLERAEPRDAIYHYTGQAGLLGIIKDYAIWATDIRFLNDTLEFEYTLDLVQTCLTQRSDEIRGIGGDALYREWKSGIALAAEPRVFVASFSEDPDLLSQWRGYGEASGYAIGFNPLMLMQVLSALPDRTILVKCIYEPQDQLGFVDYTISYLLRAFTYRRNVEHLDVSKSILRCATDFFGNLMLLASTFKHPKFAEEQEWRMVVQTPSPKGTTLPIQFRAGMRSLLPFVAVPLGQQPRMEMVVDLRVGPNPYPALAKSASESLLSSNGYQSGIVQFSAIPFRNW